MAVQVENMREERQQWPQERPMQVGWFLQLDYKLGWAAALFTVVIGVFALCAVSGHFVAGLAAVVVGALLIGIVYAGMLPRLHRRGWRWYRKEAELDHHKAAQPGLGSVVTQDGIVEVSDKSSSKLIGKVHFRPLQLTDEEATEEDCDSRKVGVVRDPQYGTLSGVMWGAAPSLSSMDPDDRQARFDAWDRTLQLAAEMGPEVYRFAWQVQTLMGEPQNPAALLQELRDSAKLGSHARPNEEIFARHLIEMGEGSVEHLTRFILTIDASKIKTGRKTRHRADEVLHEHLETLFHSLMGPATKSMNIRAAGLYSTVDLRWYNRQVIDPVFTEGLRAAQISPDVLTDDFAWHKDDDFSDPEACRIGSTWHVGLYLDRAPRRGVNSTTFWKIQEVPVSKTITTVTQPIPFEWALKTAEFRSGSAESANRERGHVAGRRVTALQRRREADALDREVELAEQVGQELRLRHYIDVTGDTKEHAIENGKVLQNVALRESMVLEPLVGRQEDGIRALLHAGRGLEAIDYEKLRKLLS
jgi:hypothetical protein